MQMSLPLPLILIASYLVGSIPFGFLVGKAVGGIDIRTVGSGNIGATNVGRTLGWHWFAVVLACDFLKGFLPALAAPYAALEMIATGKTLEQPVLFTMAAGVAAIAGHLWPMWLRFKGGKGVATGLGVVVAVAPHVSPWPPLAALALFLVTLALTRYVSLGSILASLGYGVSQIATLKSPFAPEQFAVTVFSLIVPALVVWRHRTNLVRLWRGEEQKIGRRKSPDAKG